VLLVVGTEIAIMGAAGDDFGRVLQRDGARFVEFVVACICLGITIDQRFELPVLGTAFTHIHFVLAQQYLGIYHPPADGADATCEFVEDVIDIFFVGLGSCWYL
jgi:hypothetical protein